MTRVSNARRNFAKSGGSKAVMPTDDRSGPLGGHDPLSTASVLKHVQMPDVPVDGELVFEAISVVFVAAVLCCQYINLYRTVWWLPHSYNNQALNYYLIDVHVATFSVVIACRRFPLAVLKSLLWLILPGADVPLQAKTTCSSRLMDMHSFPSGHVSRVVLLSCVVLYLTSLFGLFKFVFLIWCLAVAASRVLRREVITSETCAVAPS
uniref:Putative presqualene diphosphate phosphatase n=1 Tax=Ixodes ricinus TaxID=34613 RepID=A0A090X8H4_IXORI